MAYAQEVLKLAAEIGESMLKNGAEIYRVEDTINHILAAYDMKGCNVYVLSNGIFASVNEEIIEKAGQERDREGEDKVCSIIRHVPSSAVNLCRIAALNQLSREICMHRCTIQEAWERLDRCRVLPEYRWSTQIIACGLGCAGFAYLCGGQLLDAVITFFLGGILRYLILYAGEHKISGLMVNIGGSLLTTAVSILMVEMHLPVLQDKIVIGGIMALIPGIMFTTAVRDLLNGDYLSGTIHMFDALLSAMEIAVGVGATFAFYEMLTGGTFGV